MRGRFVSLKYTNEWASDGVAFGPNRPFHTKLSLGTVIPSQLRANNLQTLVEAQTWEAERLCDLNLYSYTSSVLSFVIFWRNASILWKSSQIFFRAKDNWRFVEQVSTIAFYLKKNNDSRVSYFWRAIVKLYRNSINIFSS